MCISACTEWQLCEWHCLQDLDITKYSSKTAVVSDMHIFLLHINCFVYMNYKCVRYFFLTLYFIERRNWLNWLRIEMSGGLVQCR